MNHGRPNIIVKCNLECDNFVTFRRQHNNGWDELLYLISESWRHLSKPDFANRLRSTSANRGSTIKLLIKYIKPR